ncbi:hypothetical protein KIN20_017968 [Parelaphostrongylus tenuis]|uniref:Uncharacterized protein n=1 Tax=Parelaphostrongylus tenuis TaxID=148309 RepID=A0AAD5QP27_PARTN|nr:hypothetical protein KIN20_017968 [Parelaphostrongylus tenuis]
MDGEAAKSQFFLAESVEKSVIDDKTDSPRNDVNYRKVEKGSGGGVSNIPQEKQAKHPIFAENLQTCDIPAVLKDFADFVDCGEAADGDIPADESGSLLLCQNQCLSGDERVT